MKIRIDGPQANAYGDYARHHAEDPVPTERIIIKGVIWRRILDYTMRISASTSRE